MKPIILFRKDIQTEEEFNIAKKHFSCTESRVTPSNNLVIGRYSVLPYYKELEEDLKRLNSKLINSYQQHQYVANFEYYDDIFVPTATGPNGSIYLTPKTYFELKDVPKDGGPFVVKGRTNSRKQQWKEKMFAEDYRRVTEIYCDLMNDPLISEQGLIIREFVPLKTFEIGINGQPFTNEWRFFYYKDECVAVGYYWSQASNLPDISTLSSDAFVTAQKAASLVKDKINFFVVDVAEGEDGIWRVIELNDGQMSGLSEINPEQLYSNLRKKIKE
jgi:hypothetical protein